ncbi:ParB/RepB/Spo0J family partition protein [Nocardioides sp. CGMCC 1.13656]|nr:MULTISPECIES: ParB/RepB/Spo0J family partition protein [unclassified Nocardioides]MBA2952144.1 ParB/RepB/Spo0J family partition protein [Nocardioides sp. CGMCC 1.13656]
MARHKQTVTVVPIGRLTAHPDNIRADVGDLTELALSIREHGILQPLTATELDGDTERLLLLAGHRRLSAAVLANFTQVPVIIRHGVDDATEQLVIMLVENCQRRDLGPMEKAEAYGALRNRGLSVAEISRRTGVHQTTISTLLNLLELDEASRDSVRDGRLNAGDAIAAVRETRQHERTTTGRPERGRPRVVEPPHFGSDHPLFADASAVCGHTTRPKVQNSGACGACWEAVIRAEATGGAMPEPAYDEVVVQRILDGQHNVAATPPDRVEVVHRWTASGRSLKALEEQTGWNVHRYVRRPTAEGAA